MMYISLVFIQYTVITVPTKISLHWFVFRVKNGTNDVNTDGIIFTNTMVISKVFEGVIDTLRSNRNYDPLDWAKFSILYTSFFVYYKSIKTCDMILATDGAKDTLELVKNVEFDVIIQDVTLMQCMYGIWEVSVTIELFIEKILENITYCNGVTEKY